MSATAAPHRREGEGGGGDGVRQGPWSERGDRPRVQVHVLGPGQELIKKDIQDLKLNRIVVASCSPLMHELTFRRATEEGGSTPTSSRWPTSASTAPGSPRTRTTPPEGQGPSAGGHPPGRLPPALERKTVPINPNVLVVGAGIAGIHASLDIANAGNKVYLVEQKSYIGGHMSRFDKTFPPWTARRASSPQDVSVAQNKNIELMTLSEVREVNGSSVISK